MNKLRVKSTKPVQKAIPVPQALVYRLARVETGPALSAAAEDPVWQLADVAKVDQFHPNSSRHRPRTIVRALYDAAGIYVRFEVADQYVRARCTEHQMITSRDSCVECFLQPPGAGYFNFEINCGGTMLLYFIENAARPVPANGKLFKQYTILPQEHLKLVKIAATLPKIVDPEITTKVDWMLSFFAPWKLFQAYAPNLSLDTEVPWRANFFKCGEDTSQPHWASWNPIGEKLRFHQPERFGILRIEK